MMVLRWAAKSDLDVRWPESDALILALGKACQAYEASLPAGERCGAVPPALLAQSLVALEAAIKEAGTGEQERAESSEARRQAQQDARPEIDRALAQLKAKYFDNLAKLEQWGLATKQSAKGVTVLKPKGTTQEVAFLLAYVAKEQSLPTAEQISNPALAKMTGFASTLSQSQAARGAGRTKREIAVRARSVAGEEALLYLQAIAVSLMAVRYKGEVSNELQRWGFDVAAAKGKGASVPPTGGGAE